MALTGDSSDNIPGVPSVGPKTAAELLRQFGNFEGIYSHLEEIARKKLREVLREHRDLADISRKLVTLHEDCGLTLTTESLRWSGRNFQALRKLYGDFGISAIAKLLG